MICRLPPLLATVLFACACCGQSPPIDIRKSASLAELQTLKSQAVAGLRFEEAALLRDQIKQLQETAAHDKKQVPDEQGDPSTCDTTADLEAQIAVLNDKKKAAATDGRYEEAAALRDELEELRRNLPPACGGANRGEGKVGNGSSDDTVPGPEVPSEAAHGDVQVGIVSTMRNPKSTDLEAWCKYHFAIGFSMIILFLDDTSDATSKAVAELAAVEMHAVVEVRQAKDSRQRVQRYAHARIRTAHAHAHAQIPQHADEQMHAYAKYSCQNVDEQAHALRNLEDAAHRDSLAVGVGVRRGMIVVEGGRR